MNTKWVHLVGLLTGFLLSRLSLAQAEPEIPLYPSKVPSSLVSTQPERRIVDTAGRLTSLSRINMPRLTVFQPTAPNGTGVIICPGGAYIKLNIESARFIAQRLNQWGITAFILTYRLPTDGLMQNRSIGPFQDIQQALRVIHQRASEWGVQPNRLGVLGSSAGGHVAAMAATQFMKAFEPGKDTIGLRPDFLILCWPVVSFRSDLAHKASVKRLLGNQPTEQQIADYSPDENVTTATPPSFLVHASDDPSVHVNSSIRFYTALKKATIPAELHLYEKGGHGFGIAPDDADSWMTQLEIWLRNRGLLRQKR